MARVKTFAVTVEWTVQRTLYVDARRPNGAAERALSADGWAEATRYADEDEGLPFAPPAGLRVANVREA